MTCVAEGITISAAEIGEWARVGASDGATEEFERAFAEAVGADHAVATASCTAGIVALLAASGIGAGDEVIVATYGWGGTAGSVLATGAVPVFADIDPSTYTLSPESVAACATPRTRAVIATHLFGHPAAVAPLKAICRRMKLLLFFDAAQALGARYQGRQLGGLGDATVFSFGRGKLLSTGEGGMVTTNSLSLWERLVLFTQHPARAFREIEDPRLRPLIDEVGVSLRIHPCATRVGLARLSSVGAEIEARREACLELSTLLADCPGFHPPIEAEGARHAFHRFPLDFESGELGGTALAATVTALQDAGVPAERGPIRSPLHLRPRFTSTCSRGLTGDRMCSHAVPHSLPVAERRCNSRELFVELPVGVPSLRWCRDIARACWITAGELRLSTRRIDSPERLSGRTGGQL